MKLYEYLLLLLKILFICMIYAIAFAFIETFFRQFINFIFDYDHYPYTTIEQFALTFNWTPLLLLHKKINNYFIRGILFPFNIYLCELIGGAILLYMFNIRVWHYRDTMALFNGFITLSYYPLWLLIYIIEDYIYHNILAFIIMLK